MLGLLGWKPCQGRTLAVSWEKEKLTLKVVGNTEFLKKDSRFSKLKNITYLIIDGREGKIFEDTDLKSFMKRASFMYLSIMFKKESRF